MVKQISLPQLIERIQKRTLTEREARDYFLIEPNVRRPFDFRTYLNPKTVDVQNFEALAKDADAIISSYVPPATARRRPVARRAAAAAHRIVAEGDSWFKLPFFYPKSCIDMMQASGRPVINLARWGDELDEMLAESTFWPYVDSGYDILLFSGGGNDVLGDGSLASFLNLYDPHHNKPSDASYYVNKAFYDNLDLIMSNLESGLIVPLKNRRKGTKLIMHGYDYAIPRPNGPWLGGPMMYQGLHPVDHKLLCRAIIQLMIDAFNLRLESLAAKYSDVFVHVDLRGTIKEHEWVDELHGKDAAARKIAARFAAVVDAMRTAPDRSNIARLYLPASAVA
jgi:hypothetical protein